MQRSKGRVFWPALVGVAAIDRVSKWVATNSLAHSGQRQVLHDWVRWTFVQNPGAAFGLQVGGPDASRWVFMALTIVALGILARLYLNTREGDRLRTVALALVCGGAIGNLVDRVTSPSGVVDFIDVGLRSATWRWPTFNLADSAVCIGACMLAWVLWDEEQEGITAAPAGAALSGESGDAAT